MFHYNLSKILYMRLIRLKLLELETNRFMYINLFRNHNILCSIIVL